MLMTGITGEGKCAPVQGDGKSRRGVHCMVQICRIPNGEFALDVGLLWSGMVAGRGGSWIVAATIVVSMLRVSILAAMLCR
jgi:hypothetical protein